MNALTTIRKSAALVASTTLLALGQSAICIAADQGDVPRVAVSYADLNMASSHGATVLLRRLQAAAAAVCAPSYEIVTAFHDLDMARCEHQIVKEAVMKVGRPTLDAAYNAKYHEVLPSEQLVAKLTSRPVSGGARRRLGTGTRPAPVSR